MVDYRDKVKAAINLYFHCYTFPFITLYIVHLLSY